MTNTINNVPRELLDSLLTVIESNGYAAAEVEVVDELRGLLSAPTPAGVYSADPLACPGCASGCFRCASPAGVGGLEVVGYSYGNGILINDTTQPDNPMYTKLVRLSDAQTIIDGLRGEVARLREERDSFQRIGIRQIEHCYQLAGLLREKFPRIDPHRPLPLSEVDHCCEYVLHKDRERLHCAIDAALSAGVGRVK